MPLASWTDYTRLLDGISSGEWRVIGWDADGSFSAFHPMVPLRHDYLVDADPAAWGTRRHGFEIRPPEAIAQEDPARTLVIIYPFRAFRQQILAMLDRMGPYLAMAPFDPITLRALASRLNRGLDRSLTHKPKATRDRAILVQGPLTPGVTEWVLRYYASRFPEECLILSTWANSPRDLLARVQPFCDRVLLNVPPSHPGPGNRNMQLVSTRLGLEECARRGIRKVLKTRTDTLITADDPMDRTIALQEQAGAERCRDYGLAHRIVITERYTLRYTPYLVSDILMFGDTEDLQQYWSAPLDPRSFDPESDVWMAKSLRELSRERALAEIYFAQHFLERIGWKVEHTLEDYWSVLRDLFLVTDERWFGHTFPRYEILPMDDGSHPLVANAVVDFNHWRHLQCADLTRECAGIDLDRILYRYAWDRKLVREDGP